MIRPTLFCTALLCSTDAAAAAFDPFAFFSGATQSDGTLNVAMKGTEAFKVESRGSGDGKGGFVLDQVVHQGGKPPKQRRWFLRQVAPNTLVGTISDAPGPVRGRIVGNSLVLNYPVKGGLKAEQVLTPQGSGRTVRNSIIVRKLGFIVAKVSEVIRKLD
ncbi:MAG: DUF3833 family protein [Sphingomicrobium sp.]